MVSFLWTNDIIKKRSEWLGGGKMKNFGLILSAILISGCATAPFVVVEQSAMNPSFTIIPYDGDTSFSRQIEREILALGLKVVERPELKFMSTDALKTESSSAGSSVAYGRVITGNGASESVTASLSKLDVVAMYPAAKSDYIIVTYSPSKEIRILKKTDLVLVASGIYTGVDNVTMEKFVASLLVHAKLIGGNTIKKQCQSVTYVTN